MPDYLGQLNQARAIDRKKRKVKIKPAKPVPDTEITIVEFIIIGSLAIINDFCDWFGLDLLLFRLVDLATAAILGLWCLFRLHKFPGARFGGSFLIELIPGLGDLSPTWTFFIFSVWAEQRGYLPEWVQKLAKTKA